MTISSETNKVTHVGDGSNDTFAYNWLVYNSADLKVYEDGVLTIKPYTVSGVGSPSGGNVVFTSAVPALNVKVTIVRHLDLLQGLDFAPLIAYTEDTHEKFFDELVMMIQQLQEQINRTPQSPIYNSGSSGFSLGVLRTPTLSIGASEIGPIDIFDDLSLTIPDGVSEFRLHLYGLGNDDQYNPMRLILQGASGTIGVFQRTQSLHLNTAGLSLARNSGSYLFITPSHDANGLSYGTIHLRRLVDDATDGYWEARGQIRYEGSTDWGIMLVNALVYLDEAITDLRIASSNGSADFYSGGKIAVSYF